MSKKYYVSLDGGIQVKADGFENAVITAFQTLYSTEKYNLEIFSRRSTESDTIPVQVIRKSLLAGEKVFRIRIKFK